MTLEKTIIAIDGLVATGKGTTAKGVAEKLGFMYMDTGSMYRASALFLMRKNVDRKDHETIISLIQGTEMWYEYNNVTDNYDIILDGENIEPLIRDPEVSGKIPYFTFLVPLREHIVSMIRKAVDTIDAPGVVVDGRDIGTVIFPNASVKVFMNCDIETRVERRYKQQIEQGRDADRQAIRDNIEKRDLADYLGPNAANVRASDAKELDTSDLTIEKQVDTIIAWLPGK